MARYNKFMEKGNGQDISELMYLTGINNKNLKFFDEGGAYLPVYELDTDPYEFLRQAEMDYERGGLSSEINSITNSKRAIHCQTDQAIYTLGYTPHRDYRKNIDLLEKLGIVTPRIIKKVSDSRNLLEHEYKKPSEEQILEALDLAYLYVYSIKPLLHNITGDFILANGDERIDIFNYRRYISFSTDKRGSKLSCEICAFEIIKQSKERNLPLQSKLLKGIYISSDSSIFSEIMHILVDNSRGFNPNKSIERLLLHCNEETS
ncbi:MAG: hypothetical protein PWQ55_2322 [Chloroflexota bacterium]|nr:hypothetical protein [Chloroflexota bacterium]